MSYAKLRLIAAVTVAVAVASLGAATGARAEAKVGDKAPPFKLQAVDKGGDKAEAVSLDSLAAAKGKAGKGTVLIFLSARCPYVAQARQPIAELAKQYGAKFAFAGINANYNEPADEIRTDAATSFAFPMLRDEGAQVADLYGAERTPEVFVVDPAGKLRYHGGVADLGAALAELGAGKPVTKPDAKAFGCTIKRKP